MRLRLLRESAGRASPRALPAGPLRAAPARMVPPRAVQELLDDARRERRPAYCCSLSGKPRRAASELGSAAMIDSARSAAATMRASSGIASPASPRGSRRPPTTRGGPARPPLPLPAGRARARSRRPGCSAGGRNPAPAWRQRRSGAAGRPVSAWAMDRRSTLRRRPRRGRCPKPPASRRYRAARRRRRRQCAALLDSSHRPAPSRCSTRWACPPASARSSPGWARSRVPPT